MSIIVLTFPTVVSKSLYAIVVAVAAGLCAGGCTLGGDAVVRGAGSEVRIVTDRRAKDELGGGVNRETHFANAALEETVSGTALLIFPNGVRQQLGSLSELERDLARDHEASAMPDFTWMVVSPAMSMVPAVLARDIQRGPPPLNYSAEELAWDLLAVDAVRVAGAARPEAPHLFPMNKGSAWRFSGYLKLMPGMRKRLQRALDSVVTARHKLHARPTSNPASIGRHRGSDQ